MRVSISVWAALGLLWIAFAGWGCGDNAGGTAGVACVECDSNASCEASGCVCNAGFSGDGTTCEDVDECATNNGSCDVNATCTNTPGSRTCACDTNFAGDGESCREIWTLLGTLPGTNGNPEDRSSISVSAGSRLFFAPIANDPALRFMRSFDVSSRLFSDPLALPPPVTGQSDFCACGFTETFVSNGVMLYLLGNRGERYDPVADSWTSVPSYMGTNRRGEAAGAFDAISNVFLLIGGRDTETTAIRMALNTEVFSGEPGTLPTSVDSAKAHTMPGTLTTFVAGGDENNGVALLSHSTGTNVWTRLADAPESLGRLAALGDYDERLWAARRDGAFFFYDPATDSWNPNPIPAPAGFLTAENVAGGTYAVVQNGGDIDVYRLSTIE